MVCYLCGKPATLPLELKDSFTAHSVCKVPTSDRMCDRCNAAINGDEKQLFYWNEGKGKWSKIWGRSLSRLYAGDKLLSPTIDGNHTEGKDTLPIVSSLATRAQMRGWILNPPEPPFTIAISETGQKHIIPWAQEGYSQDHFPVQFELDSVWVNRSATGNLINAFESLMGLSFSKTEITTGEYHSDRLMRSFSAYLPHEAIVSPYRGSRLLDLVAHVAQKPEIEEQKKPEDTVPIPVTSIDSSGQLGLFDLLNSKTSICPPHY